MFSKKFFWFAFFVSLLSLLSACKTVVTDLQKSIVAPGTESQADQAYASADYAKAFQLYLKAAQAERSYSQFMVSNMLLSGEGTPRDGHAGIEWMEKAAENGYPPALYGLAVFRLFGFGVEQDEAAAAALFEKAARLEHGLSMLALGSMHSVGLGVEKDRGEAIRWFRMAKAYGLSVEDELLTDPERVFEVMMKAPERRYIVPTADISREQLQFIQQRLAELGYDPGPIDGAMGPRTREAIKMYQNQAGLPVDGQLTKRTLLMLDLTLG
jgi:localization factor PodJL